MKMRLKFSVGSFSFPFTVEILGLKLSYNIAESILVIWVK